MMDYIPVFSDGKNCYCYFDGKFYVGKPTQTSNASLKTIVAISLITFIGNIVNQALESKINDKLFAVMTIAGMISSITYAVHFYKKHEKKWSQKLLKIYMSKEQSEEYFRLGEKQFKQQVLAIYIFFITGIFFFVLFYLNRNLYFWLGGIGTFYLFVTFSCTTKPIKKYRFYKNRKQ